MEKGEEVSSDDLKESSSDNDLENLIVIPRFTLNLQSPHRVRFLGDYFDRGDHSREVYFLLRHLIKQIPSETYRIDEDRDYREKSLLPLVCVMGNHELDLLYDDGSFYRDKDRKVVSRVLVDDVKRGRLRGSFMERGILFQHTFLSHRFIGEAVLPSDDLDEDLKQALAIVKDGGNLSEKDHQGLSLYSIALQNILRTIFVSKTESEEHDMLYHVTTDIEEDAFGPFWARPYEERPIPFPTLVGHTIVEQPGIQGNDGAIFENQDPGFHCVGFLDTANCRSHYIGLNFLNEETREIRHLRVMNSSEMSVDGTVSIAVHSYKTRIPLYGEKNQEDRS